MSAIRSKVFKSGNSVAVRLPKEVALALDTIVWIEKRGDKLIIWPEVDVAEEKRKLHQLIEDLRAIGPPDEIEKREPFEFPERPGL